MTLVESDAEQTAGAIAAAKGTQRIAVCIPARNEAPTIGLIVDGVAQLRDARLVDEIIVIDDGSDDATALEAAAAGACIVESTCGPGKGQALRDGLSATRSDIVVFLDADVTNFSTRFVTTLVQPLLHNPALQLVKARYRRRLDGRADEGGRVNELLARPLLRRFFPPLASIAQPLAGECAVRRSALGGLVLADGYGIEIGLLIDVFTRFGRTAISEADLGERIHRNRPLHELRPHADEILATVLARTPHCTHEIGALP